jgi:hypothetical protein
MKFEDEQRDGKISFIEFRNTLLRPSTNKTFNLLNDIKVPLKRKKLTLKKILLESGVQVTKKEESTRSSVLYKRQDTGKSHVTEKLVFKAED